MSENLGYKKHLQITVPIEYQDGLSQSFPLIIVFDMQNQRNYQYILHTIDYLTANEQIPSAIIVGVDAGDGNNRFLETQLKISAANGLGEKNEQYIFNELIPLVRNNFKANSFTLLIGHSRYGYFTSYLLAKHLNELNAVISVSPFLEQSNINLAHMLPDELKKSNLAHKVYYRFGMGDDFLKDYNTLSEIFKSNHFKNLNADGWLFPQAIHTTTPGLTIARSLYEIFEYWSYCQNQYTSDKNKNVKSITSFQKLITEHYGVTLAYSIGNLNGKGYSFYNNSDYLNAMAAWQILVEQYPNFAEGYLNIAKCQKKLQLPTLQAINEFKKSLQLSSIYTKEEKTELLKEADSL